MTLSDHGLFLHETEVRVTKKDGSPFEPESEREVFDLLGLVWKEVNERDGFDAVAGKSGDRVGEFTRIELRRADASHSWIE